MHDMGMSFLKAQSEDGMSGGLDSTDSGRREVRACAEEV